MGGGRRGGRRGGFGGVGSNKRGNIGDVEDEVQGVVDALGKGGGWWREVGRIGGGVPGGGDGGDVPQRTQIFQRKQSQIFACGSVFVQLFFNSGKCSVHPSIDRLADDMFDDTIAVTT